MYVNTEMHEYICKCTWKEIHVTIISRKSGTAHAQIHVYVCVMVCFLYLLQIHLLLINYLFYLSFFMSQKNI